MYIYIHMCSIHPNIFSMTFYASHSFWLVPFSIPLDFKCMKWIKSTLCCDFWNPNVYSHELKCNIEQNALYFSTDCGCKCCASCWILYFVNAWIWMPLNFISTFKMASHECVLWAKLTQPRLSLSLCLYHQIVLFVWVSLPKLCMHLFFLCNSDYIVFININLIHILWGICKLWLPD